jgi:alcohol dehydrogenase YqhD (iron-dependent ADH family)
MQNFIFENPTKIIFGRGCISQIGQEIRSYTNKILMVYGRGSILKNGVYEQVSNSLKASGISSVELSGAKSNPTLSLVYEGISLAKREKVEAILAAGGGSVIDTAKTIAAGVMAEEDIWEYFSRRLEIKKALPVFTVLTVSASTSEMNQVAVITNEKTHQKLSMRSLCLLPKVSIMDPSTLFTLSREYTAYSAVDAISHMLEGYFNNTEPDSLLQDRIVESLIKTIMEKTEVVLKNPRDYNARADMMWATTLGFNGLATAGMGQITFPAHMIGHSMSALFDIAHGATLSMVLPGWMTYATRKNPAKFARFAREIFMVREPNDFKAAVEGVQHLRSWMSSIGCPTHLQQCGISGGDVDRIVTNASATAKAVGMEEYTEDVIAGILDRCR